MLPMTLVKLNKKNNVTTLTLNDPDQLNAMSVPMGKEFKKIIAKLKKDKSTRVVVITGEGRAFSSGGDLQMLEKMTHQSPAKNKKDLKGFYSFFLGIRDLPQPVIAAVNGHAIGAGFCVALACDLRYVSEDAKLGANFARIGLSPGMAGTYSLTRLLGPTLASELMLTGKTFSAKDAKEYGLVNGVLPAKKLLKQVYEVAEQIAQNGPLAVTTIKKGIQLALHKSFDQMLDIDSAGQARCFQTKDIKRGIKAIRAKEKPQFKGN
jgi:enoyl-CoA hydratase/carnithine racemase